MSTRRVDDSVEQPSRVVDRFLAFHISLPDLGESGALVAVDSDEELLRVEAAHLDEPVLVGDGAADDDEDEVVVFVELCSLAKLFGVFNGERVELEDAAKDRVVVLVRLVEVEPEEPLAGEEWVDVLAAKIQLLMSTVVDDRAGVTSGPSFVLRHLVGRRLLELGGAGVGGLFLLNGASWARRSEAVGNAAARA